MRPNPHTSLRILVDPYKSSQIIIDYRPLSGCYRAMVKNKTIDFPKNWSVFSELDQTRRHALLELAQDYQTFITTVEMAYFEDLNIDYNLFRL